MTGLFETLYNALALAEINRRGPQRWVIGVETWVELCSATPTATSERRLFNFPVEVDVKEPKGWTLICAGRNVTEVELVH